MFITLDCAIQRPRVPGRARSAAARKNVNNKRETRKHFIQLWSLMPRSCSISLNGGIPMLRICFALIAYIHGCHFVTAPQGGILLPCMPTHFASATLRCLSHSRAASAGSNRHRRSRRPQTSHRCRRSHRSRRPQRSRRFRGSCRCSLVLARRCDCQEWRSGTLRWFRS